MALASAKLYGACRPFPSDSDDQLAELSQWQLSFTFLAALMIKVRRLRPLSRQLAIQ